MKIILNILMVISTTFGFVCSEINPPHIFMIKADDLGWNDVSFHGSDEIPTPNIDTLAMSGIVLHNYYAFSLCTPSRAAFMSGRNPIELGLQHGVLMPSERSGLPLSVTTLPQYLKRLGYTNHMIGKWHLGYMTKKYTPTYRGFDSHFGYWNGQIDHFDYTYIDKTQLEKVPYFYGIDMHNGTDTIRNLRGQFATDLFTEMTENIILNHNTSKPLFFYFSHQVPHRGNLFHPIQAPPHYVQRVKHIKDVKRRIYAANVVALDDSVGKCFRALHKKRMLENIIIIFVSDNGGETQEQWGGFASNYPLRGEKGTLWEGGTRVPAFIWSPLLKFQNPRISLQLMQVTDWLPTLYEAAGGNPNELRDINGISMWQALMKNEPSPRTNLLYNIDPVAGNSAIRLGQMKLINGSFMFNSWPNPPTYDILNSNHLAYCFENENIVRNILLESGKQIVGDPNAWRNNLTIKCDKPQSEKYGNCEPEITPCLFNLDLDPCENYNIADQYPKMVSELLNLIYDYQKTSVPPQSKPSDPAGNPDCHNFAYVPWLDPEYYYNCNEYL